VIGLHGDAADDTGGGGSDLAGISGVGFGMSALDDAEGPVADVTSRGWPFNSKKSVRVPSGCGSLMVRNLMMRDLPDSISTVIFFAGLQAIEKRGRRQNADVGIGLAKFIVFGEDFGIEQTAQQAVAAERMTEFFFEGFLLFF